MTAYEKTDLVAWVLFFVLIIPMAIEFFAWLAKQINTIEWATR